MKLFELNPSEHHALAYEIWKFSLDSPKNLMLVTGVRSKNKNFVGYNAEKPNGDFDEWYTIEANESNRNLFENLFRTYLELEKLRK